MWCSRCMPRHCSRPTFQFYDSFTPSVHVIQTIHSSVLYVAPLYMLLAFRTLARFVYFVLFCMACFQGPTNCNNTMVMTHDPHQTHIVPARGQATAGCPAFSHLPSISQSGLRLPVTATGLPYCPFSSPSAINQPSPAQPTPAPPPHLLLPHTPYIHGKIRSRRVQSVRGRAWYEAGKPFHAGAGREPQGVSLQELLSSCRSCRRKVVATATCC
jgi:hypothetical protein